MHHIMIENEYIPLTAAKIGYVHSASFHNRHIARFVFAIYEIIEGLRSVFKIGKSYKGP